MLKNLSKIITIVGKKNTLVLSKLIPVRFLAIFFELFSIASFLPLMQQAFGGSSISSNESLSKISEVIIKYLFKLTNQKQRIAISKSKNSGFNIISSKNLKKNYNIFSVKKSLNNFIKDNKRNIS